MQFDPQSGHEQSSYRRAIVLSPYSFNQTTHFAVICPITRQKKTYPFEVKLPDCLNIEGVILTDQEKNIDWKSRNMKIIGSAPEEVTLKCIKKIHTFYLHVIKRALRHYFTKISGNCGNSSVFNYIFKHSDIEESEWVFSK